MLQSLILQMNIGISYGSGALKALQNDNIPELDLLVREAIQNSSDASLEQPEDSCSVNFTQGKFSPPAFNSMLSDIGPVLDKRFQCEEADFLEIRDSKTSGLTGPVRVADLDPNDHGNFFKLVFDTGKEQTNANAGGSWGYGKSVYYRVGIGLVVFYSQIIEDGEYKSRLIVSLIENDAADNALLKEIIPNAVGRAWWGKKAPNTDLEVLPLEDNEEIERILNVFGVRKFSDKQTGTSIIIPYIDKKRLLHGIFPDNCGISDEEIAMCAFKDDIAQYIELAVQKWYAPRIFNKKLKDYSEQKWLAIRINGVPMVYNKMRPFFQLVQELYTTALSENHDSEAPYKSSQFPFIKCAPIPSQKLVTGRAGHVAFIQVTKDELGTSGSIIKPYTYLRLFSKSSLNDPIVMFSRTGMILDYKTDDRWAKGIIKPENEDEYAVAFFVPDCTARVKNDPTLGDFANKPFNDYLRKSEKSDHMDWTDPSSCTLITNVKNQVCTKVNTALKDAAGSTVEGTASKLSGKLGKRLLPTIKFGKKAHGGSSGGGGGSTVETFEFILNDKCFSDDSVVINFTAKFSCGNKAAIIGLFVESETGLLDYAAWKDNIGTTFPISIKSISDCTTLAQNSGTELPLLGECTADCPKQSSDFTTVRIITGENDIYGFEIKNTVTNALVCGKLTIHSSNRKYRCTIKETKKLKRSEVI